VYFDAAKVFVKTFSLLFRLAAHTIYPGNNMCQKCGRKSGLWVLHEMVNKTYGENMKKQARKGFWPLSAM
jgi:hypothetical protein